MSTFRSQGSVGEREKTEKRVRVSGPIMAIYRGMGSTLGYVDKEGRGNHLVPSDVTCQAKKEKEGVMWLIKQADVSLGSRKGGAPFSKPDRAL